MSDAPAAMNALEDPFQPLAGTSAHETGADDFAALTQRPAKAGHAGAATEPTAARFDPAVPALARLQGFDLCEQPLVAGLAALPGEVIPARSTVVLRHAQIGHEVLLMFAGGDMRQPVIVGVIEPQPLQAEVTLAPEAAPAAGVNVRVDGERQVIEAEREVVLRCGDASITLTRAGKVIIKGHYILSRSTGHNKIKGAAIDIN